MKYVTYLILHPEKIDVKMEKGENISYDAPYLEFSPPMDPIDTVMGILVIVYYYIYVGGLYIFDLRKLFARL